MQVSKELGETDGFVIREDDLSNQQTQELLAYHLQQMHANSPQGSVFALDLSGLRASGVTVWTAWRGPQIVAVGALKDHGNGLGELKSMRTHPDHIRQGAARAILNHIIDVARSRGFKRLSLETGSGAAFEPAIAMYRQRGFVQGEAFGDYRPSQFNQFFPLFADDSRVTTRVCALSSHEGFWLSRSGDGREIPMWSIAGLGCTDGQRVIGPHHCARG